MNYVINPTTFIEGTYGRIQNELAGGNENGILANEESNRLKSLKDFPLLYPNAGVIDRAVLRLQDDGADEAAVLGRQVAEPAAGLRLGRPHRVRRPPQPAVSRLAEHQPDAGLGDQPDEGHGAAHDQGRVLPQPQLQGAEHGRRRHREPELPGLRELRQRHQQHPRHRVRLRERGAGGLHAVHADVAVRRRQHDSTTRRSSTSRTTGR